MKNTSSSPTTRATSFALLVVFIAGTLLFGGPAVTPAAAATQNAIQIENAKPGTANWYDFAASATQDAINGYGSKISVNPGGPIHLYITTPPPRFPIHIFR